jgi:hypothetical protein
LLDGWFNAGMTEHPQKLAQLEDLFYSEDACIDYLYKLQ